MGSGSSTASASKATGTSSSSSGTSTSYLVKVTADALNVRKGPGTSYAKTGCIRDKGTYTIVEERDGWGRLKSGLGWIKLSYTTKVGASTAKAAGSGSKKSVDALAGEVIAGKWGNGAARKSALEAAGYDYAAVQKRVNELLR